MNSSQVMELEGEVDPDMKISKDYVVQLPPSECSDELILTPPLSPEELHRFSKRNLQGMQEHVEAKAMKLASKKNLEGNKQNAYTNSFAALSNADLISRATNMGVCIPDNDFTCIDMLRELECVRRNLDQKNDLINNKQECEDGIFVTNEMVRWPLLI